MYNCDRSVFDKFREKCDSKQIFLRFKINLGPFRSQNSIHDTNVTKLLYLLANEVRRQVQGRLEKVTAVAWQQNTCVGKVGTVGKTASIWTVPIGGDRYIFMT